jgi:c-di-GMP-binding flagellar brake protein YcgR
VSRTITNDTRKHSRASVELPVTIRDPANLARGGGIRFDSADVSGGGAFLRSDLLFEIGELLSIEFDLPGGRHIGAQGRVVRVSRSDGRDRLAGMGVEFVGLSPEDRAAIEACLT